MFIHWGLYAIPGLHEQALSRLHLDRTEYENLQKQFDPKKFDPEQWVLLAKECGMQYICFTTKHHDGFCMWDTKYSDYNIMNTPYGKDVLKMLADACKKHNMLLSIYYSNPDWHHLYGYNPNSTHQWRCVQKETVDLDAYKTYIKNQVTELLMNYGPIYTFFWDIPPKVEDPSLNELIYRLQPGIFINDRGWSKGDFSTPERDFDMTENAHYTRMTEACNSVDLLSWGYRLMPFFYSTKHLLSSIDLIMSRGGNYLLNVGPSADGEITEDYRKRLLKVGDWYNRMAGCLEQVDPEPFEIEAGGKFVASRKDGKTYLHFYNGIVSTSIILRKFPQIPKHVKLMNTGETLAFHIAPHLLLLDSNTGIAKDGCLHITGIPVDDLAQEPIVLELTWE